jgi:hypothetical protein
MDDGLISVEDLTSLCEDLEQLSEASYGIGGEAGATLLLVVHTRLLRRLSPGCNMTPVDFHMYLWEMIRQAINLDCKLTEDLIPEPFRMEMTLEEMKHRDAAWKARQAHHAATIAERVQYADGAIKAWQREAERLKVLSNEPG